MTGSNFSNSFSLTDEIVDIIRERILKGEYKIGEKIKENQIASELRVSRTPIREAFKQLENEGPVSYTHLYRFWTGQPQQRCPQRPRCWQPVSYTHLDVYKRQTLQRVGDCNPYDFSGCCQFRHHKCQSKDYTSGQRHVLQPHSALSFF